MKSSYRKKLRLNFLLCTSVLLFSISVFLFVFFISRERSSSASFVDHQSISIESILIDSDAHIAIHYPVTENQIVNSKLKSYIDSELDNFMNDISQNTELSELYINFEVFRYDESIVSFVFDQYSIHRTQANGRSYFHTMTFDLLTGNQIELKDLFRSDQYLYNLSEQIYKQLKVYAVYDSEVELESLR